MQITLRRAEKKDEFSILRMVKTLKDNPREYGWPDIVGGFDLNRDAAEVSQAVEHAMAFLAESEGAIVGFVYLGFGAVGKHQALHDKLIYVIPEARQSAAGTLLLDAAKSCADQRALPLLLMNSNSVRREMKDALLKRKGFEPVATLHMYSPVAKETGDVRAL